MDRREAMLKMSAFAGAAVLSDVVLPTHLLGLTSTVNLPVVDGTSHPRHIAVSASLGGALHSASSSVVGNIQAHPRERVNSGHFKNILLAGAAHVDNLKHTGWLKATHDSARRNGMTIAFSRPPSGIAWPYMSGAVRRGELFVPELPYKVKTKIGNWLHAYGTGKLTAASMRVVNGVVNNMQRREALHKQAQMDAKTGGHVETVQYTGPACNYGYAGSGIADICASPFMNLAVAAITTGTMAQVAKLTGDAPMAGAMQTLSFVLAGAAAATGQSLTSWSGWPDPNSAPVDPMFGIDQLNTFYYSVSLCYDFGNIMDEMDSLVPF